MLKRVFLCLLLAAPLWAQTHELDLNPGTGWVDTGVDLKAGDTTRITATGQLQYADARQSNGPEGLSRSFLDVLRNLPLNDAGRGTLVGRIGNSAAARPFLIGAQYTGQARIAGRLFVTINQTSLDSATGSYHIKIEHTANKATPAAAAAEINVPPFPQNLLDSIPRRVNDSDGNAGDRVNFIVVGSQDQVQAAFKAAGWVTVDRTNKDAILRGLFATFSKEAYVTLPMSELELFGRPQDLGYAQADPLRVIASRHHFRIWKAPFTLDGMEVWAGAGTHDIGFDRDRRNNGITHKIDPNTDGERDYIRDSLAQTGMVVKSEYMTPTDPVTSAKTATGSGFTSDGRTIIIYLAEATNDFSSAFGSVFCSVLKQNNPDGGNWGACSQYIDTPGKDDAALAPLSTKYRILIVPGFMSSCFADSPAFQEGEKALKENYGLDVDLLQVSNDSSETNAKTIGDYIRQHSAGDSRKYIIVGYSKGTPDVQVALVQEAGISDHVAAFISAAGASGGSQVADLLPQVAEKYVTISPMKSCKGDMASGLKSLQRASRQAFLAAHPNPVVPTYSIIAKSDQDNTSKALLQTWRILSTYGVAEDGQLLRYDAIVPGSKFLGAAQADHFAIALPFDKSTDATIRSNMDKTVYPRAALLEALIRYVTADLPN